MEYIIITLFGIFIGITVAGYMFLNEINRKNRKIANQKVMIKNRDKLIDRQRNILTGVQKAVNKKYYTVEKLENEIKELFTDCNLDK